MGANAQVLGDEIREPMASHLVRHVERIPEILDGCSEPFGSSSLLPTYVVSRETRKRMTVALSGDGADELFAGYNKYLGDVYRKWYLRLPGPVRRGLLEPAVRALPVVCSVPKTR